MSLRRRSPGPAQFAGLGQLLPEGGFDSLGATLWEWLHPEQRRAEYELQGRIPPEDVTYLDVMGAAREDALDLANEAGEQISEGLDVLGSGAKKVGLALAIGGGIYLAWKMFGGRK